MTSIPERIPQQLTAGDRWRWRDAAALAKYPPADGWALKYRLHNSAATIDLTAAVVDGQYEIDASPSTTAAYAAGEYEWSCWVEKAGERYALATGRVQVLPDPATATGDIRTHAEKVLEAIRAVIEGRASKDQESYSIAGRSLSRTPLDDLLQLESRYVRRVAEERAKREQAAGRGGGKTISVRFGRSN